MNNDIVQLRLDSLKRQRDNIEQMGYNQWIDALRHLSTSLHKFELAEIEFNTEFLDHGMEIRASILRKCHILIVNFERAVHTNIAQALAENNEAKGDLQPSYSKQYYGLKERACEIQNTTAPAVILHDRLSKEIEIMEALLWACRSRNRNGRQWKEDISVKVSQLDKLLPIFQTAVRRAHSIEYDIRAALASIEAQYALWGRTADQICEVALEEYTEICQSIGNTQLAKDEAAAYPSLAHRSTVHDGSSTIVEVFQAILSSQCGKLI